MAAEDIVVGAAVDLGAALEEAPPYEPGDEPDEPDEADLPPVMVKRGVKFDWSPWEIMMA